VFSLRTRLAREQYEQAVARWEELGLPQQPPRITTFEEATTLSYHEAQEFAPPTAGEAEGPAGAPSM
jgi:hypothetical protein